MLKKRVLCLCSQDKTRESEVALLLHLGFEVFCPKMLPDTKFLHKGTDIPLCISEKQEEKLNKIDFHSLFNQEETDLINESFDIIMIYQVEESLKSILRNLTGLVIFRSVSEEASVTLELCDRFGLALLESFRSVKNRFFFGTLMSSLPEKECELFQNRRIYLPTDTGESALKQWENTFLTLESLSSSDFLRHRPQKIGIICGDVKEKTNCYQTAKELALSLKMNEKTMGVVFGYVSGSENQYDVLELEQAAIQTRDFKFKDEPMTYVHRVYKLLGIVPPNSAEFVSLDDGIQYFEDCDYLIFCGNDMPCHILTTKPYGVVQESGPDERQSTLGRYADFIEDFPVSSKGIGENQDNLEALVEKILTKIKGQR